MSYANHKKLSQKYLCCFLILLLQAFLPARLMAASNECVILLHGLSRTYASMHHLEAILLKHQYDVVNRTYPSTRNTVERLANKMIPQLVQTCRANHATTIHFVTHSIGGIILQTYLSQHTIPELKYVVMLGPPNHGSPLADLLSRNPLFQTIFTSILGPSIVELTTQRRDVALKTGHYKMGIIAGNYCMSPFSKWVFGEANDGKVSVSSARLSTMHDFIVLPVSHTFMMQNKKVENQVLHFLQHGYFQHESSF